MINPFLFLRKKSFLFVSLLMILYYSCQLEVFVFEPRSSFPLIVFLGLEFFYPVAWFKNDHGDSGNRIDCSRCGLQTLEVVLRAWAWKGSVAPKIYFRDRNFYNILNFFTLSLIYQIIRTLGWNWNCTRWSGSLVKYLQKWMFHRWTPACIYSRVCQDK